MKKNSILGFFSLRFVLLAWLTLDLNITCKYSCKYLQVILKYATY